MTPSTKTAPAAKKGISAEERVAFFRAKLDAEWGPYDLQHVMEADAASVIVIDTRDAESFAKEHIPGAVNIPTDQLESRLGELSKDKDVVPYCWSVVCHLATRASLLLAEKGYRVHELAGGIEYWKNYKLPVKSGTD